MLHEFLKVNRSEILALSESKSKVIAGLLGRSAQLKSGLPLFYDQLIKVLEYKLNALSQKDILKHAAHHGKEALALGYSLSHVVHAYGSMCQSITEMATNKNAQISAQEFHILNGCLDLAIASAVSEYQHHSDEANEEREVKHLGFLAHELRNALSSATIAQEMIRAGLVGVGGSTANVLEANLVRMRNLIDRSLSEVRMRADSDVHVEKFRLSDLFDQIVITANIDAAKKKQCLGVEVDSKIEMVSDRQFLLSAIANLIQNAIKYSKHGANIWLRGRLIEKQVHIEIEDECGGIVTDKINSLFAPYTQVGVDRSGLGLGLSITQKAVERCQGTIVVNNKPGIGCAFVIRVPAEIIPPPSNKRAVPGEQSIQPDLSKKTS